MEKPPNFEKKFLTISDIRHFIVDEYGNAEVIEEGKDKLVIKQGDSIIKVFWNKPEEKSDSVE